MPKPILYHAANSVCAQKVRATLAAKEIAWTSKEINLAKGDQHKPSFKKLNPHAKVPVLVVAGKVITESSVICEFLEDAYPEVPVFPTDPIEKAAARILLQDIEAGLHDACVVLSFSCHFKRRLDGLSEKEIERHLSLIEDPDERNIRRSCLFEGEHSKDAGKAVRHYRAVFQKLSSALRAEAFFGGPKPNIIDFAYAPYALRAAQLSMSDLLLVTSSMRDWLDRIISCTLIAETMIDPVPDSVVKAMGEDGERCRQILTKAAYQG